jgi:hypothetical protein
VKAAPKKTVDPAVTRKWAAAGAAVVALVAGGVYFLLPSRAARIAARTIAMQEELLSGSTPSAERRKAVDEITRNVDRLQPDELRQVRDALFARLKTMREKAVERYAFASPEEKAAIIDEDLERIRVARRLIDATDHGGMRPVTEAELLEREKKQQERREQAKQAAAGKPAPGKPAAPVAKRPDAPPPPRKPTADEQRLAADYFEALTKRAKEKKVDLGRMFGRPPGRG